MEGYAPYLNMIVADGVAETAYILSTEGAICATNLPIKELPRYEFDLEQDDGTSAKIVVDERVNLLEALANKGVPKKKEGLRLYNQKYVPVRYDEDKKTLYLKKVSSFANILDEGRGLRCRDQQAHHHRYLQRRAEDDQRGRSEPRRAQQTGRVGRRLPQEKRVLIQSANIYKPIQTINQ